MGEESESNSEIWRKTVEREMDTRHYKREKTRGISPGKEKARGLRAA